MKRLLLTILVGIPFFCAEPFTNENHALSNYPDFAKRPAAPVNTGLARKTADKDEPDNHENQFLGEDRRWSMVPDSLKQIVKLGKLKVFYVPLDSPSTLSASLSDKYYDVSYVAHVDTTGIMTRIDDFPWQKSLEIGYNHVYSFTLKNKLSGEITSFSLSKKTDLAFLQRSCCWTTSNLDPWTLMSFNPKYGKFVFVIDVNPHYNYGDIFYLIMDKHGNISYQGLDKGWGGGGADGEMTIGED